MIDIFVFYGKDRRFKGFPYHPKYLIFRTNKNVDWVVKGLNNHLSKKASCTDLYLRGLLVSYARANKVVVLSHTAHVSKKQGDINIERNENKFTVVDIDKSIKKSREKSARAYFQGLVDWGLIAEGAKHRMHKL